MSFILQKLLGIDPAAWRENVTWALRFNASLAGWLTAIIVAAVFCYVSFIYRREGAHLGALARRTLSALRIASLLLLVALLLEPVLAVEESEVRQGWIAVLIDESLSMGLCERYPTEEALAREELEKLSRLDLVNCLLADPGIDFLGRLLRKGRVRLYKFSSHIWPPREEAAQGARILPGKIEATGLETRLGDCLRECAGDLRGQSITAMVVFTDGRCNAGEEPVAAARYLASREIPVYTVGVGNPDEPRDLEMVSAELPEVVFANDPVKLAVALRARGYAGELGVVELRRNEKLLSREELTLAGDGSRQELELKFKLEEPGEHSLTLALPEKPGELLSENNTRALRLKVIEDKIKVLYVEGQDYPRWEYRYLKNALLRDHTMDSSCLLASRDGSFFFEGDLRIPGYPETESELFAYDVIIFGDVSPEIFTAKQLELTVKFVNELGGGFLMIAGARYAPLSYLKTPLADLLPVVVDPGDSMLLTLPQNLSDGFPLELTLEGRRHPVTRLENDEEANREAWKNLPGQYWYFPARKAKEAATLLALHPVDRAAGEKTRRPLLATGFYGSGRTMFLGVDSLWRWRHGIGDRYFYRLYAQAIHYLATGKLLGPTKCFQLSTERTSYTQGEKVALRAVLRDRDYQPLKAARVTVYIRRRGEEPRALELRARAGSAGLYEGEFAPVSNGEYRAYLLEDEEEKRPVGEITFEVKPPSLEFENPRMDAELLRNVAAASRNGSFLDLRQALSLPELIREQRNILPVETEYTLWDNWRLLGLLSLLLIVEWVLRKRSWLL